VSASLGTDQSCQLEFARLSDLKKGDLVFTQSHFTLPCVHPNVFCCVEEIRGQLMIRCSHGWHLLDQQLMYGFVKGDPKYADWLVGIFKCVP
jgi:hypothetical protein